jgi:hypothetical protein
MHHVTINDMQIDLRRHPGRIIELFSDMRLPFT